MNWIVPILRISMALTLNPIDAYVSPTGNVMISTLPEQIFSTDVTAGALLFEHIGIESRTIVYTVPPWAKDYDTIYFSPFETDFWVTAYLQVGPVKAGIEHLCSHPTITAGESWDMRYGGKNTVYLTYEYKE